MAFVQVAQVDDVPEGAAVVVAVGGEEIALCNVNGRIYAIANICTHDGGSLDQGETFGYVIECPRHGAQFDIRTGSVLAAPAPEPIRVFPVRVVDGNIEVDAEG